MQTDKSLPWQAVLVGLDTPDEVGCLRAQIIDKSTNGDFELSGNCSGSPTHASLHVPLGEEGLEERVLGLEHHLEKKSKTRRKWKWTLKSESWKWKLKVKSESWKLKLKVLKDHRREITLQQVRVFCHKTVHRVSDRTRIVFYPGTQKKLAKNTSLWNIRVSLYIEWMNECCNG